MSLRVPEVIIMCTAVHVSFYISDSFSLLRFLFLFIANPKARWDAKSRKRMMRARGKKSELHT